jgi:hypothetical protein
MMVRSMAMGRKGFPSAGGWKGSVKVRTPPSHSRPSEQANEAVELQLVQLEGDTPPVHCMAKLMVWYTGSGCLCARDASITTSVRSKIRSETNNRGGGGPRAVMVAAAGGITAVAAWPPLGAFN